jgi:hypothetical protein
MAMICYFTLTPVNSRDGIKAFETTINPSPLERESKKDRLALNISMLRSACG